MDRVRNMQKPLSDREKVNAWLASIHATQDEVDEVLELCKNDRECRAYYVKKYTEDCECLKI